METHQDLPTTQGQFEALRISEEEPTDATKEVTSGRGGGGRANPQQAQEDPALDLELKLVRRTIRAHEDDIHGLAWVSSRDSLFVSGSKDNQLKMWRRGQKGQATWIFKSVNAGVGGGGLAAHHDIDYTRWVTALTPLEDGISWASGTRDGHLHLWESSWANPTLLQATTIPEPQDTRCKHRNLNRVTCLLDFTGLTQPARSTLLVGQPASVAVWDLGANALISRAKLHANDWVYCLEPVQKTPESWRLAVVIGTALGVYDFPETFCDGSTKPTKIAMLWKPEKRQWTGDQRPHIASLKRVDDTNKLVGACFDGCIRLFDIDRGLEREIAFHERRVWQALPLRNGHAQGLIASCADDGFVALWDLRQPLKPAAVTSKHHGRVSCLLEIPGSPSFIAASCPDDAKRSEHKGTFFLWDIRRMSGGQATADES